MKIKVTKQMISPTCHSTHFNQWTLPIYAFCLAAVMEKNITQSNRCLQATVVSLAGYVIIFTAVAGYYGIHLMITQANLEVEVEELGQLKIEVKSLKEHINILEHEVRLGYNNQTIKKNFS